MRPFLLPAILLGATALFVACSGEDESPGPSNNTADAGVTMDATPADMGEMADAGGMDAAPDDAGMMAEDTGGTDAAAAPDAGPADIGPDGGIDTTCEQMFFDNGGACGGPLEGTQWRFVDSCGGDANDFLESFRMDCPILERVEVVTTTSSGTFVFNPDLSYALDLEDAVQIFVDVDPTTCLGPLDCVADIQRVLGAGAVCVDDEGICKCEVPTVEVDDETGADYDSANNQLSISVDAVFGPTRTFDYCVSEGVLRYREVDDSRTYILVED